MRCSRAQVQKYCRNLLQKPESDLVEQPISVPETLAQAGRDSAIITSIKLSHCHSHTHICSCR